MVHAGGRPRTVSMAPNDMEALGQEMLDWVMENKPLHLKQWYSIEKMILYREWKAMIQVPEFLPYYEKALSQVSLGYIDGTIDKGIANRFLRGMFRELKEEENEEAEFKSKLASDNNSQVSEEARQQLTSLNNTLKRLQESAVNKLKEIRQ